MPSTKISVEGDKMRCVYDDRFLPLLESLGTLKISRASTVEYEGGEWVARHNGVIIARGKQRVQVISDEVAWLERNL